MIRRASSQAFTSASDEASVARYRPLCGLAIVALGVGALSAMALLAPLFWFVPVLGVLLSGASLRRIAAADPPLVGRSAAWAGLGLSMLFAVAAPTDFVYYRWVLRQEAQRFALEWFRFLAQDEPHKACQLLELPSIRQPLDDQLWAHYPVESEERTMLEGFVGRRPVHALLLLRDRAVVRYYQTDAQWTQDSRDRIAQTFAVTFNSAREGSQTFFVRLIMERTQSEGKRRGFWRIVWEEGDFLPAALGGKPWTRRT